MSSSTSCCGQAGWRDGVVESRSAVLIRAVDCRDHDARRPRPAADFGVRHGRRSRAQSRERQAERDRCGGRHAVRGAAIMGITSGALSGRRRHAAGTAFPPAHRASLERVFAPIECRSRSARRGSGRVKA